MSEYRKYRRMANEKSDWAKLNDRVTALEVGFSLLQPPQTTPQLEEEAIRELKVERNDLNRRLNETYMERNEARKQRDDLAHELDEVVAERDKLKANSFPYWKDQFAVAVKELHDLKEELKDEEGRHQATAAAYSSLMGKLVQIRLLLPPNGELTKGDWVVGDILKILDGESELNRHNTGCVCDDCWMEADDE